MGVGGPPDREQLGLVGIAKGNAELTLPFAQQGSRLWRHAHPHDRHAQAIGCEGQFDQQLSIIGRL